MTLFTYRFDIVMRQMTYAGSDGTGDSTAKRAKVKSESCKRIKFETNVMDKSYCASFDTDENAANLNDLIASYPTMSNLMRLLRDTFAVSSKVSAFLYYQDEEGDLIRLSSDKEWREVAKNYLKQALDKGLDVVEMRMLFSPKHHYKENEHGKVDFNRFNFENYLMKMIRNEVPGSSKTDNEPKKVTENVPTLKEIAAIETEVAKIETLTEEAPKTNSGAAPPSLGNDFHARIERILAETGVKKAVPSGTNNAVVETQSVLGDDQKEEILSFVKQQIPEIVEEYLKSKVVSVEEKQTSIHEIEDSFGDAVGDSSKAESAACDNDNENANESVSIAPASTEVAGSCNDESLGEIVVESACELPYHIDFLFHETESSKFTVLSGCLFHKLWCVRNSGLGSFCKDAYVTVTSIGFEIATCNVPDLQPGEVGNIVACVKAPEAAGTYDLEFKVLSKHHKEFVVNASLGFTVRVIGDALGYAQSLSMGSGSCTAEAGSEVEVESPALEDEVEQADEDVECEDSSDDKDFSSMCEDETVIDEDNFGSTDDEMEMIEDFTFIPLPDCFDLNRIPAVQSTSEMVMSSRGSRTNSESKKESQVTRQESEEKMDDCVLNRDRRVSEMSAPELVEPPVMVEETLTSEIDDSEHMSLANSSLEEPKEEPSYNCDANEEANYAESTVSGSASEAESRIGFSNKYISPSDEKRLLQKLNNRGFCDQKVNREALVKNDFDFNRALNQLIADFEPLRRQ